MRGEVMARYEVRNAEVEKLLQSIGRTVKGALPPGYGFTLLLFGYTPNNELFYVSSAQRQDMINTMREFIAKFEHQ
jgi:hypothetical protein